MDVEGANTRGATLDRTAAGVTLGTIAYMSPEQASGEQLYGCTDPFSLGVVLYECATGRHPFSGQTTAVGLAAILNKPQVAPAALNPELPLRLQEVINNCLEKDRELRYQSAADLRADLKRVRRDIESGHSLDLTGVSGASRAMSSAISAANQGAVPSSVSGVASQSVPVPTAEKASIKWIGAGLALVAIIAVAVVYVLTQREPAPPAGVETTQARSNAAVQGRLDLASASLAARNYRAAAAYAGEVLAIDPNNADARRIRDESQTMLGAIRRGDRRCAPASD